MRVIIAARLSKVSDDGETGLESQTKLVRAWCERQGHDVVDTVADRISGTSAMWARRNLRPWIMDAGKRDQYDAIVGYRLDRLTRGDAAGVREMEEWAHTHHKMLLTENGLYFPCEGSDGIRWDVEKRVAHEYVLGLSEKVSRSYGEHVADGKLWGTVPWGYRSAGVRGNHWLEPIGDLAPYVRGIFERYADDGMSLAQICAWLDSEGVHPPARNASQWSPKSVGQIIRNSCYVGRRTDARGRTVHKCPVMVAEDLWARAGKRLGSTPRGRRGPVSGSTALLTGVLFCGRCRSVMYRSGAYYRCSGRRPGHTARPKGCGVMLQLTVCDWTARKIMARERQPYTEQRLVPGSNHDADLERNRLAIADVTARMDEIDDWDGAIAELRSERKRLQALPATADRIETVETGQTLGERWEALDDAGRRDMMLGRLRMFGTRDDSDPDVYAVVMEVQTRF